VSGWGFEPVLISVSSGVRVAGLQLEHGFIGYAAWIGNEV